MGLRAPPPPTTMSCSAPTPLAAIAWAIDAAVSSVKVEVRSCGVSPMAQPRAHHSSNNAREKSWPGCQAQSACVRVQTRLWRQRPYLPTGGLRNRAVEVGVLEHSGKQWLRHLRRNALLGMSAHHAAPCRAAAVRGRQGSWFVGAPCLTQQCAHRDHSVARRPPCWQPCR